MENTDLSQLPKKDYYAPMHTAEHILNQTMCRLFQCGRSKNAHIEKDKSKCDYELPSAPDQSQMTNVERRVNEVIEQNMPVLIRQMARSEAALLCDLSRLPQTAGEELRMVLVGDYDVCPCIGAHVQNTSEIGRFKISSWNYENGRLRLRYKLEDPLL